ncbi:ATP-binding cassette domain-containing protein [Auraticoccus sp. F435]|uniref:ATP-binding cassette domain-containing protein n=1 Tax=Auraticoccus cholistanensis TaxID=2656650 RepID=A0A6A9UVI8_9ACTN|nr:oligopeptide/dipeptide ABC transporter ATP-binding protein [Auraticoccus cholistanensis]MVA75584.1 ATP-binding cassette domain-containing protein [Auraticoccus cholistanensis]
MTHPTDVAERQVEAPAAEVLLETRGLTKHFPIKKGFLGRTVGHVKAVDGVDLRIRAGQTVGLVGESGCGKSTLARTILRAYEPTAGEILYRRPDGRVVDLAPMGDRELKPYRRDIRMVFQDPFSSLNPRMTLLQLVGEPLRVNDVVPPSQIEERVATLLTRVGLRPEYLHRYPNAFSGGERQRIGLARALALEPRLVVADEAVSALDVSVRAQIINLMKDLQVEEDLTYLFVSHDLGMVEYMSDEVVVMYVGRVVETGPTDDLYTRPYHPYTEALLSAVPDPDPNAARRPERIVLRGEVADPSDVPPGCPFHPRCFYAQDRCRTEVPALREISPGRRAACHFSEELQLRGIDESEAA